MADQVMENYRNAGLLILRLGIGAMFIAHGLPKLMAGVQAWGEIGKAMGVLGITVFPHFWGFMATFAEFFGGVALITGILFRPFCALLTFDMFVASCMHLSKGDGFIVASHAIEAGIIFFSLILIGPGRFVLLRFF